MIAGERGNAAVEFVGWTVVLVVPVVYLIIALAQVQAASFAVVSAADAAARIIQVDSSASGLAHARTAVGLALSDQRLAADPATALTVTCRPGGCSHGAVLRVEVGVAPPLVGALTGPLVMVDAERTVVGAAGGSS